jgi:hypothetical protein
LHNTTQGPLSEDFRRLLRLDYNCNSKQYHGNQRGRPARFFHGRYTSVKSHTKAKMLANENVGVEPEEIELNSPSAKSCEIRQKRRSIQSHVEISLFPLVETLLPSALNNTFRNYRVRDSLQNEARNR